MTAITKIHAREIIDSRGNPTLEAEVTLASGEMGRAAVPSGASTGEREALELRDGDKSRYLGKGVTKAVANVNGELADAIKGMDVTAQEDIDEAMLKLDGTENKDRLGANALLAVSMACAHTAASKGMNTAVGDEGGFAPDLPSNEAAIEAILEAIDKAGFSAGKDVFLALDAASSEFCENGVYDLASENRKFNSAEFTDYLADWVDRYPIISIEDGMDENDWDY